VCLCFFLTNDILFKHKTTPAAWFYNLYHQHIISSTHHHIITSSHHHIITSSHHHIITSSHHHIITSSHINTSSHHHIITSSHHHIITSSHQHIITSSHHHIKFINTSSHILYHFVDFVFKSGGIININIIAVIEF